MVKRQITHVQVTFDNKVLLRYKLEDVNPVISQWAIAENIDADRIEIINKDEIIVHNPED